MNVYLFTTYRCMCECVLTRYMKSRQYILSGKQDYTENYENWEKLRVIAPYF